MRGGEKPSSDLVRSCAENFYKWYQQIIQNSNNKSRIDMFYGGDILTFFSDADIDFYISEYERLKELYKGKVELEAEREQVNEKLISSAKTGQPVKKTDDLPISNDEYNWLTKDSYKILCLVVRVLKIIRQINDFKRNILDVANAIEVGRFNDGTKFILYTDPKTNKKTYDLLEFFRRLPDLSFLKVVSKDAPKFFKEAVSKIKEFCKSQDIDVSKSKTKSKDITAEVKEFLGNYKIIYVGGTGSSETFAYLTPKEQELIIKYIKDNKLPMNCLVAKELADKYLKLKCLVIKLGLKMVDFNALIGLVQKFLFGHKGFNDDVSIGGLTTLNVSITFGDSYEILWNLLSENKLIESEYLEYVKRVIKEKACYAVDGIRRILERKIEYPGDSYHVIYSKYLKQQTFIQYVEKIKNIVRILIDKELTADEKKDKIFQICPSADDFEKLIRPLMINGRYKRDPNLADYGILISLVRNFFKNPDISIKHLPDDNSALLNNKDFCIAAAYCTGFKTNPAGFDERTFFEKQGIPLREVPNIEKSIEASYKLAGANDALRNYRMARKEFWRKKFIQNQKKLVSVVEALRERDAGNAVAKTVPEILAMLPFRETFYEEEFKYYALFLRPDSKTCDSCTDMDDWELVFGFKRDVRGKSNVFFQLLRTRAEQNKQLKGSKINKQEIFPDAWWNMSEIFVDTHKGRVLTFARKVLKEADFKLIKQFFDETHLVIPDCFVGDALALEKLKHRYGYLGSNQVSEKVLKDIFDYMEANKLPFTEDVFLWCLGEFQKKPDYAFGLCLSVSTT